MREQKRAMRKTFVCDDSMIITIPIGGRTDTPEGQLMPEKFHCVYRDSYKIFVENGKPQPLGAAQVIAGVFILTLGGIFIQTEYESGFIARFYVIPSVLFVVSGMLSYAAGIFPNMHVTRLSFSLNIISFLWSIVALFICGNNFSTTSHNYMLRDGITGLIMILLVVEKLIALFLIYWLSKAVCRNHFNTLPIILLKQGD